MRQETYSTTEKYHSTLYQVVFESTLAKMSVITLFCFLLLQPVSAAFASELPESQSVEQEQDTGSVYVDEVVPQIIINTEAEELPAIEASVVTEFSEEAPVDEMTEPLPEQEIPHSTDTDQDTSSSSADTSEDMSFEPNDTQMVIAEDDFDELNQIPADTDLVEDETASTSQEVPEFILDHNSSAYAFNTNECASVGDGAFYCSSPKEAETFAQDGVFAAPDSDGDLEIFVRLDGKERMITSNTVDDSAPYYDALSERIVWHANYNDRYQIMSYDLNTAEQTKLTSATYNNMEPIAYGDLTLWQAWIHNNWEIIMYDGKETTQLTHNDLHDISPHMRGGYIVWQTQYAEGWKVAVYDQKTKHIEYVDAEGGSKIENPRFVLVYDSTNDAGDVQTIGYDLDNKTSFTLNSIPASLPDELPEPDQTGETRALIQNKSNTKGNEIEESDIIPTTGTSTEPTIDPVPTLDMTSTSTAAASSTHQSVPSVQELVVSPLTPSEVSQEVSHISDILIPPLQATSSTEVR